MTGLQTCALCGKIYEHDQGRNLASTDPYIGEDGKTVTVMVCRAHGPDLGWFVDELAQEALALRTPDVRTWDGADY